MTKKIILIISVLFIVNQAYSQKTIYWTGSTSSDMSDRRNWTDGTGQTEERPSSQNLIIENTYTAKVFIWEFEFKIENKPILYKATLRVNSLIVSNTKFDGMEVRSGATLNLTKGLTVETDLDNLGTIEVSGSMSPTNIKGYLINNGTITFKNNSTINSNITNNTTINFLGKNTINGNVHNKSTAFNIVNNANLIIDGNFENNAYLISHWNLSDVKINITKNVIIRGFNSKIIFGKSNNSLTIDGNLIIGDNSYQNDNASFHFGEADRNKLTVKGEVINNRTFELAKCKANLGSITNNTSGLVKLSPNSVTTVDKITNKSTFNMYDNSSLTTTSKGTCIDNSGDIIIESNSSGTASLITEGSINNNGKIEIQRYLDPGKSWQLISSPSNNEVSTVFLGHYLNYYDQANGDFKAISSTQHKLSTGEGFVAKLNGEVLDNNATNPMKFIKDKPNTGTVEIELSKGVGNTYFGLPGGFNLVGNPYPSNLDWDKVYTFNRDSGEDAITPTLYYYVDGQNENVDKTEPVKNGWQTYNSDTGDINKNYINIAQGFGVQLRDKNTDGTDRKTGTFYIPNSARTHELGDGFNKKFTIHPNSLKLTTSTDKYYDNIILIFNDDATNGFDEDYDAYKFNSFVESPTPFFIGDNDERLAVNELPTTESVKLGFLMDDSGEVTISIDNSNGFEEIILEDKKDNTFTNILNSSYTFKYELGEDEQNRFTLHFNKGELGDDDIINKIKMYSHGKDIFIITPNNLHNAIINVYNLSGQRVSIDKFDILKNEEIHTNLKNGIYILEVSSDEGISTTKINITSN